MYFLAWLAVLAAAGWLRAGGGWSGRLLLSAFQSGAFQSAHSVQVPAPTHQPTHDD